MTVVAEHATVTAAPALPIGAVQEPHPLRSLPGWMGRTAAQGCQRCAEAIASRPVITGGIGLATWPFLSSTVHYAELGIPATILSAAVLGGRRHSLLTLADVIKFRFRSSMVKRKFPKVIGTNAAISKTLHAVDVIGNPTKSTGKQVPKLRRFGRFYRGRYIRLGPRRTPFGMVVTVDGVNIGAVAPAFEAECGVIAGSFGAVGAEVHKHPVFQELTTMSLTFEDPFRRTIPFKSLPKPSEPGMVVVGLDRDHEPVEQSLWLPTLAVGEMGSGKSSLAHVIIAGVVERNWPLHLWMFDPKGGVEFFDYEATAYRYVSSPYLWVELLRQLIDRMQSKLDGIRGKYREAPLDDPDYGIDLVVIDELLAIFNFVEDKDPRNKVKVTLEGRTHPMKPSAAFNHFLSQQRAARMCTIALSQVGDKDRIKNRDLFPGKMIFRVASDEVVTMLGFSAKNHRAHEIPGPDPKFSGQGYAKTVQGVVNMRTAFLTDSERAETARRVGAWTEYYRARERTM